MQYKKSAEASGLMACRVMKLNFLTPNPYLRGGTSPPTPPPPARLGRLLAKSRGLVAYFPAFWSSFLLSGAALKYNIVFEDDFLINLHEFYDFTVNMQSKWPSRAKSTVKYSVFKRPKIQKIRPEVLRMQVKR